ncbi:MAG: DUF4838 domain-containing protein [Ruminococcaceae bacterium]|nr:DUF4838 domain-containing protein [Oscillospiraceae bacterium]
MYTINKIASDHVIDFAAEELKKYLRMMMPRCGEIEIYFSPDATDGFRLGLLEDFGLDISEADDLTLDDIIHIDTTAEGGIIAGSNPRSVLLAVYRFLNENGCRWLFPGVDGEYIPMQNIVPVKYHKMADCRYRGQCNEGAESQQCMLETIDFSPKIGLNVYMLEFDNPKVYYNWYYDHSYNEQNRPAEHLSDETVLQWKRQCEAEISKRGLQFHDMGHGWTAESFGIRSTDGWVKDTENPVPKESEDFLAMIDGKRELYKGVALNTNFCMSNAAAREKVVKQVVAYASLNRNVDYLHVWLADGYNNHCECEECRKKIPSDWYVMLMNEIDDALTAEGLSTRIVFCCYLDTTWPCETVTIKNPDRFTLLLGAISRDYTAHVPHEPVDTPTWPFKLNDNLLPTTVEQYNTYARQWQEKCGGLKVLVYEYHYWRHQYYDPSGIKLAKLIHNDVIGYKKNGFDGIIEDGSQRSYFPNGFSYFVYASTLFDNSCDFEKLKEDYFSHAYGEDWREIYAIFEKVSEGLDPKYLEGGAFEASTNGVFYDPTQKEKLQTVFDAAKEFDSFIKDHFTSPVRAQTAAVRLLIRYVDYIRALAEAFILKCEGNDAEANKVYFDFMKEFGKHEYEIERYFDHALATMSMCRIFGHMSAFHN